MARSNQTLRDMWKRLFDITFSTLGFLAVLPVLMVISLLIRRSSPGPVFYRGERVGRFGKPFRIFKFRTMVTDADRLGPLATPDNDPRVTALGKLLRKYKLDELPQLLNVLRGEMSLVGPRPEAALYHVYYTEDEKKKILSIRPGMTDYGSLTFHDEGKLLEGSKDPVMDYIRKVKNEKVKLQMKYIEEQSVWLDFKIILQTIWTVFKSRLSSREKNAV